jgi:nucleoside-diphosphate kinase
MLITSCTFVAPPIHLVQIAAAWLPPVCGAALTIRPPPARSRGIFPECSVILVALAERDRTPLFPEMLYKPPRPIATSTHLPTRMNLMTVERTFSIIKPDATSRSLTGAINAMIEQAGLRIVAQKRVRITREQAQAFYAVHSARPFFGELVDFMISGPVVVQVLEGENAIAKYRDVMGATDPAKAAPGTIRKVHALSIGENSVHGSDAPDTAAKEIAQFFSGNEIVG